jgi:predicted DNA-binding protein YlxM (UPF0122 family)
MALGKLEKYAKTATQKETKLLDSLAKYYRGDYSLGYMAEKVHMPLRAVMEFMQKHRLPYYSDSTDTEEGLRRITEIRTTL